VEQAICILGQDEQRAYIHNILKVVVCVVLSLVHFFLSSIVCVCVFFNHMTKQLPRASSTVSQLFSDLSSWSCQLFYGNSSNIIVCLTLETSCPLTSHQILSVGERWSLFPPRGGGGYSWKFLVGVCHLVLQILARFRTKKWNFPHLAFRPSL